jgi:hypothetical protein
VGKRISQLQRFLPILDGSDFSLQINERDQLGAKDMTGERSEAVPYENLKRTRF